MLYGSSMFSGIRPMVITLQGHNEIKGLPVNISADFSDVTADVSSCSLFLADTNVIWIEHCERRTTSSSADLTTLERILFAGGRFFTLEILNSS